MVFLIQQTMLYAVPLMIVALAGVCAERSGVINLALEGIMIFGAFMGVIFIRMFQGMGFVQEQGQIGRMEFVKVFRIYACLHRSVKREVGIFLQQT